MDISDPATPQTMGTVRVNNTSVRTLAVSGGFAFVLHGYPRSNVSMIDVLDPIAPFVAQKDIGFEGVARLFSVADTGMIRIPTIARKILRT